jgi:phosphoribosylglycinamide formyltransferase-1
MKPVPFYNPAKKSGPMKVAAFMSGSGSNIKMLLKREKELIQAKGHSPFHVVFIFSDRSDGACQGKGSHLKTGSPISVMTYAGFTVHAVLSAPSPPLKG